MFKPALQPPSDPSSDAWLFALQGNRFLVHQQNGRYQLPRGREFGDFSLEPIRQHYLGDIDGLDCYAAELATEINPPDDMAFVGLRQLFGKIPDSHIKVCGRAVQIIDWDRNHQFCGRCGTPTERAKQDLAKVCPNCELRSYPRISPAIIVRIQKGDKILLARNARYPSGFHSVLAGFVEPGETLEETVAREIFEEVGLHVKNIRYFGSQPWPFPDSLMLGFTCDYASGEITLHDEEISFADWFTAAEVNELQTPSSQVSISGELIEDFLAGQGVGIQN